MYLVVILTDTNSILGQVTAQDKIPFGNKIAIGNIVEDEVIIKSGYSIGRTTESINEGSLVHVHNLRSERINFPDSIINEILRQMNIKDKGE